jgi:hypothetical protein
LIKEKRISDLEIVKMDRGVGRILLMLNDQQQILEKMDKHSFVLRELYHLDLDSFQRIFWRNLQRWMILLFGIDLGSEISVERSWSFAHYVIRWKPLLLLEGECS